jgi:diguanylate cyclase (GGDEF)-like protein
MKMQFRLFDRKDTPLAAALIAAAVLVFQRPLHYLWDLVQDIQAHYHVDLLPGLIVLVGVSIFHAYRKRQDVKAQATAAAAEAEQANRRSRELERLMVLGRALSNTLDRSALLQSLWQHMPDFSQDREFWAMLKTRERWVPLVQSAPTFNSRGVMTLQAIAERAFAAQSTADASSEGILDGEDVCFPMVAGDSVVGVLGIRNSPPLTREDRRILGAAAAVIAMGVRNVQLFRETRELSLRDSLTGCFNRGHALETLENELRRSKRTGNPVSIVMFDVDRFKAINDQLGHIRGDDLLQNVGAMLARVLRSSDLRCRYGGDEFLVILPDTPLVGAEQVAEGIRREMTRIEVRNASRRVTVTASLGVATAIHGETNVTNFIDRADRALYEAKRLGRNRLCVGQPKSTASPREAQILTLPPRAEAETAS